MTLVIQNAQGLLPGEQKRIDDAVEALAKDPHAPNELSVRIRIHVHNEYPKHLGYDGEGKDIVALDEADEELKAEFVVKA